MRSHGLNHAQAVRASVNVHAVCEEHLDHVRVLLRHGPHERGLTARAPRFHARALVDQHFDNDGIAGAGGNQERRLAREERQVRIRAGGQQPPNHRLAAVLRGEPERRRAQIVAQSAIVGFQGFQHLGAQRVRRLRSFITQREVAGFTL